MTPGRRPWRAIAAAGILTLAACGDDDDAGDEVAASTTVAATSVTSTVATSAASAPPTSGAATSATAPASSAPGTPPPTTAPAPATPAPEPAVTFTEVASVDSPVDLTWRDGDDGLYVVEQPGRVVRLAGGDETTVLDITELTEADGERGLLGLAFDPAGERAYINYTDADGWTVITEYPVDADGTFRTGDEARLLLEIEQPYANHNGGDLTFGPDGMLYIGMGDGGDGGDPQRRATDPNTLLGKMLRIDPTPSDEMAYTVPADNPFTDGSAAPEIWSSGLRNPWKFSFDRETGDLWIADVGQNAFEEISVAPAADGVDAGRGLSFGWSAFEGDERYNDDVSADGHTPPFSTYGRDLGCSISGGVRARGGPVAELAGWYVYADYCSGQVWALEVTGEGASMAPGRQVELGQSTSVTAVVDGPDGEVYVVSKDGPVVRLDPP